MTKIQVRDWHPPMAYRAATYGFRNQRLSEMISLALPSTEHSHALKPSGSPIKVTNIEIMIKFWFLSWCYCSSNWVGMRIIVYKCVWNKVFRHYKQSFTSFHSIALLRLWYMIRLKFYRGPFSVCSLFTIHPSNLVLCIVLPMSNLYFPLLCQTSWRCP